MISSPPIVARAVRFETCMEQYPIFKAGCFAAAGDPSQPNPFDCASRWPDGFASRKTTRMLIVTNQFRRTLALRSIPYATIRAISAQMEPQAVPSGRKCAHWRCLLQQPYSVRPIPAERNMF